MDRDAGPPAFATITAALAAANASSAATRTVHIAPGIYGPQAGETFPLVVRGISLVGAGRDQTILRGSGPTLFSGPAVSPSSAVNAALLAGDTSSI